MIYTVISFQIITIRRRVIWPRFDFDLAILTHSRQRTCTHEKNIFTGQTQAKPHSATDCLCF